MVFQITPEDFSSWQLRTTVTQAVDISESGRRYISSFQIPGEFSSQFVAVGTTVIASNSNWRFGGYLSQEFSFDSSGYRNNQKAFYRTVDLEINNVTIVQLPILTDSPYKLRFFPPSWFVELRLQIWEYTGIVVDTSSGSGQETEQTEVEPVSQINQLDAGVYALAEGISELLPEGQGSDLIRTTRNILDIDLGFL